MHGGGVFAPATAHKQSLDELHAAASAPNASSINAQLLSLSPVFVFPDKGEWAFTIYSTIFDEDRTR